MSFRNKASILKVLKTMRIGSTFAVSSAAIAASAKKMTTCKISQHLQLHSLLPSSEGPDTSHRGKERSLVIMFPFYQAPPRVVAQYCQLYHEHGHNVLTVSGSLKHFLWPPTGFILAREVLDYLSSNALPLSTNNFYIHGFSIGAYIYSLVMIELSKNKTKYASIEPKIKAQVFDSLVIGGFDNMSTGMISVIQNPALRYLTHTMFSTYLTITKPYTKDLLERAIEQFKHGAIRSPILLYYCLNDAMSNPEAVQELLDLWQKDYKLDVHVKCWERSLHAGHLKAHPDQYSRTLDSFLAHVQKQSLVPQSSKL